jgi:hypothetical protein
MTWFDKFGQNQEDTPTDELPISTGDVMTRAKDLFGVTNDPSMAIWIIPDGKMLNGSESGYHRDIDHGSIAQAYDTDGYLEKYEAILMFERDGGIRFSIVGGDVYVEIGKEPTVDQLMTLQRCVGNGNMSASLTVRDGGAIKLHQDSLNKYSIVRVIKEFYSLPSMGAMPTGIKKACALPRGHFDGLAAAVEAMKPMFLDVMPVAMENPSCAAAELSTQLASRMWDASTEIFAWGSSKKNVKYIALNYVTSEAVEITVQANDNEVNIVDIDVDEEGEIDIPERDDDAVSIVAACVDSIPLLKIASGVETKKVIRERRYRSGYILRDEVWTLDGEDIVMERMAYNPSGDFIGNSKEAHFICTTKGIRPEKASPDHSVCSIGYSTKDKKWYGWSHWAICGFKLGDMLYEEGTCTDSSVPYRKCGKKPIETLQEARQAAINFARSVS